MSETGSNQGWKYRLVIDSRYYILCFSVIDYHKLFALNFFLLIIAYFMLFAYILSISLNLYTLLLFLLSLPKLISFRLSYAIFLYITILKNVFFYPP